MKKTSDYRERMAKRRANYHAREAGRFTPSSTDLPNRAARRCQGTLIKLNNRLIDRHTFVSRMSYETHSVPTRIDDGYLLPASEWCGDFTSVNVGDMRKQAWVSHLPQPMTLEAIQLASLKASYR